MISLLLTILLKIAINGYKSVVKGLVSAILNLFPEESTLWTSVPVFDLYCLTNENSPPLASYFWDVELTHPVLGGWVREAAGKFPMQPRLLQVMRALSSDNRSANNAYASFSSFLFFYSLFIINHYD